MAKEKGGTKGHGGQIEERARALVQPIIDEYGFRLWDVCFEKEGAMWYLRILFDKDEGITSDECEQITEPINEIIDRQDFLSYIDILDVGSPGLSAKLRHPEHFRACVGKPVRATVRGENGKEQSINGILTAYSEEENTVFIDEAPLQINKCKKINLNL